MLRQEQNELLTRTGPGTAMGEMFRRYWVPALLGCELPEPGGAPVRVQLLGERLVAFRDPAGAYGLIEEFCAHRCASLWFGRNEEGGLRCPYHGWKYDASGQCVELPSEPETSGLRERIRLRAYPLVPLGDILWTCLGAAEHRPGLPQFEVLEVPQAQRYLSKRLQFTNWLQALEGGIDSSHVSWLHRDGLQNDPLFKGARGNDYNLGDARPVFEVTEHPSGLFIGARRRTPAGEHYWRITPWCMPAFTMIPPRGDHTVHGHFWVPIDDERCWAWSFDYHPLRALTAAERAAMEAGKGIHTRTLPGSFIPVANKDNDYLIDRAAQRAGASLSGVAGIAMQDAAMQESMGPIVDRSREHLTSTDDGIIMARNRLLRAARALAEHGTAPPGTDPATQRVRSAALLLPPGVAFATAAAEALHVRPGVAHASV